MRVIGCQYYFFLFLFVFCECVCVLLLWVYAWNKDIHTYIQYIHSYVRLQEPMKRWMRPPSAVTHWAVSSWAETRKHCGYWQRTCLFAARTCSLLWRHRPAAAARGCAAKTSSMTVSSACAQSAPTSAPSPTTSAPPTAPVDTVIFLNFSCTSSVSHLSNTPVLGLSRRKHSLISPTGLPSN